MKKLLFVFVILPCLLFSQTRKQRKAMEAQRKSDQQVIGNLKNHEQFFTDQNSQNAPTVLKNDELVRQYIINQFKAIGIQPKGTSGFIQQFKIDDGKQLGQETFLKVNGTLLAVKKDYFPLAYSASKHVSGMPAMALREKGVPWFADAKDWIEENTKNDSDVTRTILKEASRAATKGATALFVYNSGNLTDNLRFNKKDKTAPISIPVIYITSNGYKRYFTDQSQVLDIDLNVRIKEATKNASDIVGFIDNKAATNIMVATSYSKANSEEDETRADNFKTSSSSDIISGTSMLIELARMLYNSKFKSNNYIFVAYDGEDTLSRDSKWLNDFTTALGANYIINLDEIAMYSDDKKLTVATYGTPPEWIETIKPLNNNDLEIIFDNISFAFDNNSKLKVPLLNLSTPHDISSNPADNSKINYAGELSIARFIYRLIEATDNKGKLAFVQNAETSVQGQKANATAVSDKKSIEPK